jgi:cysteine synthase A
VDGDPEAELQRGSRIEGIGRPRMEPSFLPGVIDRMMRVPDAASLAAMRILEQVTGRRAGGSSGTGLWAAFRIVAELKAAGHSGSVVSLICDPGERYTDSYYSDEWVARQQLDLRPYTAAIERFLATGVIPA